MRIPSAAAFAALALLLSVGIVNAAETQLPLVGGKRTLAMVNDEPLTLEEFDLALARVHEGATEGAAKSHQRPSELLDRLITAKVVVQEARNIGLDELPEVEDLVRTFEEDLLRGALHRHHAGQVKGPDKKEVEKRYRDAIREVKLASILIDNEEDGRRIESELRAGADFAGAARRLIEAGGATGSPEGQYVKFASLSPEIAKVVSTLKRGKVSPLVKVGTRFTLVKLEDTRYLEDAAAREKAASDALRDRRAAAWKSYVDGLKKKYVKVNAQLLESLDYESPEPGLEKLSTDRRALADVKGEKPVAVADLTEALRKKFYHGAEGAAERKRVNARKGPVLEDILAKRVVLKEARRKGLDRSESFRAEVKDFRNGVLFGYFIQKVVDPEAKVDEAEGLAYYQQHLGDYMMPEKVRVESLAFSNAVDAENAAEKLRNGTDLGWMRANAPGRLEAAEGDLLIASRDTLILTADFPEPVRRAISGATPGDYRIYGEEGGSFYVIHILERVPVTPRPYEDVRVVIEKRLFREKREAVFRDWEEKLRKASEVRIFATGEELDRLIGRKAR